jgi:hypothetical protein
MQGKGKKKQFIKTIGARHEIYYEPQNASKVLVKLGDVNALS